MAVNDHAHMIGSHHQSQVTSYCQSSVLSPVSLVVMILAVRFKWPISVVIGQF